ncbi:hypothetical protein INR49_020351 [Caranx melampygus]|nr:hypothetical protein INR49_020351 [Caranx melampygus]
MFLRVIGTARGSVGKAVFEWREAVKPERTCCSLSHHCSRSGLTGKLNCVQAEVAAVKSHWIHRAGCAGAQQSQSGEDPRGLPPRRLSPAATHPLCPATCRSVPQQRLLVDGLPPLSGWDVTECGRLPPDLIQDEGDKGGTVPVESLRGRENPSSSAPHH